MALEEAVLAIVGKQLSNAAMCVLMAQSSLETGDWQKTPNYNFGGLKATGNTDYSEWGTTEGFGATETKVKAKFRAYPNAVEGAKDFVRLLANSPRYSAAWVALEAGDPINYAIQLGKGGYYTGDPLAYSKGVARRWAWCGLRMMSYGTTPDEVKRFQKDHQIDSDGLIGPMTRAAIKAALGD